MRSFYRYWRIEYLLDGVEKVKKYAAASLGKDLDQKTANLVLLNKYFQRHECEEKECVNNDLDQNGAVTFDGRTISAIKIKYGSVIPDKVFPSINL